MFHRIKDLASRTNGVTSSYATTSVVAKREVGSVVCQGPGAINLAPNHSQIASWKKTNSRPDFVGPGYPNLGEVFHDRPAFYTPGGSAAQNPAELRPSLPRKLLP